MCASIKWNTKTFKNYPERRNIIYFILPYSTFLLPLRQIIIIMSAIIGRKHEIEELERLYYSDRPEFVAVYGRRRVGRKNSSPDAQRPIAGYLSPMGVRLRVSGSPPKPPYQSTQAGLPKKLYSKNFVKALTQ